MQGPVLVRIIFVFPAILWCFVSANVCNAQTGIGKVNAEDNSPENEISELQERLDRGDVKLVCDKEYGYLKSLLSVLKIPVESQLLVFSKTSMQQRRISPRTPRAVYFSESVSVGYCQSGDILEVSAADPNLGTVFYTLSQAASETTPQFERNKGNCLVCHSSSRTGGIPGHLARSLFVDSRGQPVASADNLNVDHTTPIEKRWGGWYVTGQHGVQKHLGNFILERDQSTRDVDNSDGFNVLRLDDRLKVDRYLSPHSDIVALMILEHQVIVHNQIVKAGFETRKALHDQISQGSEIDPSGAKSEDTARRIQIAGEALVDALLLVDEARLTSPIRGTSGYAEVFVRVGPRDSEGRSLRDLDMKQRMFKYPCSYLIYSDSFNALPPEMRVFIWKRLWVVLSGEDPSEKFRHLGSAERQAIIAILRETKDDLPDYWKMQAADKTPESRQ